MPLSLFRLFSFEAFHPALALARATLLVAVASGCGGSRATAAGPGPDDVAIRRSVFTPSSRTIPVGTTVTWRNQDATEHTVTGDGGPETWDSGTLARNGAFSRRFTTAGTYRYTCSIHPEMGGTIVVTLASRYQAGSPPARTFVASNVAFEAGVSPGQ